MAIGRAQAHFAAAPSLVGRWFDHVGPLGQGALVELVDRLYIDVGHVAVIAKFAGRHNIGASTEHERYGSSPAEGPVAGIGVTSLASKHTRESGRRLVEIVHGENGVGAENLHGVQFCRGAVGGWSLTSRPQV